MRQTILPFLALLLLAGLFSCNKRSGKPRILVFSKTEGFRHSSIGPGKLALLKLGQENGFDVDTTEDAAYFHEDSLQKYSAVVFLSTTLNVLDTRQEVAFERYIQAGGGFVGIHAATDTEYDWWWFGKLVGAYFTSHPETQTAKLQVVDRTHGSTQHLPESWERKDEWYNFKQINPDVKVLIRIDESSYKGGTNGNDHPMAWYHEYDGGRAWYTELGHTDESYSDELFLKHVLGGLQYAIGDNRKLDYSKARSQYPPDEDRFTKTILTQGTLFEPTEMTILPNLDVLIAQRRGQIMLYKNSTREIKQAGMLDVYWKTNTPGVNAEEGVLGIQKDPNFDKNGFVYIFYSPLDTSVNRLSRFKFVNDSLDLGSEKVILQLYSQREICCHTGGSIAFGADNILYVSTGDNSTPFDEPGQPFVNHGFGPMDDRPGHEQYDARRSSANTNDLRGKILRIRINEDGTYTVPDGNLFPKGTEGTKPEIYVMGTRNPYRISVDRRTGYLYWGEVGPDAGNDSIGTRGSRGYDEVNQAKKPGFYGWPLFVGYNYPYNEYDYATGKSGAEYVAAKPVNKSRNNTGLRELPPATPAFIWYPYAPYREFPQLGTGGRNAMAGPVYYAEDYPAETRFPEYYNGRLFIYDWMRRWVKVVTMDDKGDYLKMEPFAQHIALAAPIDMEMGPDGRMYVLEYGSGWFSQNPDAGLSRIDYNGGNRAPKVGKLEVDKTSGSLPLSVKLKVEASDPEKDALTYIWNFGGGKQKETQSPETEFVFDAAGDQVVTVTVRDKNGAETSSNSVNVFAGNTIPQVRVNVSGNQSFWFPGLAVPYRVDVQDAEDQVIDPKGLYVYTETGRGPDRAEVPMGHVQVTENLSGRALTQSLDCKSCHQENKASVGPSYVQIAQRYAKDPNRVSYLVGKIIKGGGGVWGETAMSAHPDLKAADAELIVNWILSLAGDANRKPSLPPAGTAKVPADMRPNSVFRIQASYTDQGASGIGALTGRAGYVLAPPMISFHRVKEMKDVSDINMDGMRYMILPKDKTGWFRIDSIHLSGIRSVELVLGWQSPTQYGIDFELRLDSPDGTLWGSGGFDKPAATKGPMGQGSLRIPVSSVTDDRYHHVYVVARHRNPSDAGTTVAVMMQLFNR